MRTVQLACEKMDDPKQQGEKRKYVENEGSKTEDLANVEQDVVGVRGFSKNRLLDQLCQAIKTNILQRNDIIEIVQKMKLSNDEKNSSFPPSSSLPGPVKWKIVQYKDEICVLKYAKDVIINNNGSEDSNNRQRLLELMSLSSTTVVGKKELAALFAMVRDRCREEETLTHQYSTNHGEYETVAFSLLQAWGDNYCLEKRAEIKSLFDSLSPLLSLLSKEIVSYVMEYLDEDSMIQCESASVTLFDIIHSNNLWKKLQCCVGRKIQVHWKNDMNTITGRYSVSKTTTGQWAFPKTSCGIV